MLPAVRPGMTTSPGWSEGRSPDGAKRNPGEGLRVNFPDSAAARLHPATPADTHTSSFRGRPYSGGTRNLLLWRAWNAKGRLDANGEERDSGFGLRCPPAETEVESTHCCNSSANRALASFNAFAPPCASGVGAA